MRDAEQREKVREARYAVNNRDGGKTVYYQDEHGRWRSTFQGYVGQPMEDLLRHFHALLSLASPARPEETGSCSVSGCPDEGALVPFARFFLCEGHYTDVLRHQDESRRVAALSTPPVSAGASAAEDIDRDICSRCGKEDSCCTMSIGIVGHGIPLDDIGVADMAELLYTGSCVRDLLDRAKREFAAAPPSGTGAPEVSENILTLMSQTERLARFLANESNGDVGSISEDQWWECTREWDKDLCRDRARSYLRAALSRAATPEARDA